MFATIKKIPQWFYDRILAVPVRIKVVGIGLLPILILGFTLSYWITTGLSDWLSYILSDVRVQAAMAAGQRSVNLVTFLAGIASVFFSLLLSYILARPILSLKEMAQKVANGNLDARAQVWAKDEIGDLAVAINTMTDHLVKAKEDLERKNRNLDAINQVALAGDRQEDIHDILYEILQSIVKVMNLKTGWVFLRDPEKNVFHLASWCGIEGNEVPYFLNMLGSGSCQCEQTLNQDEANPLIEIRECGRLESFGNLHIGRTHITIPLVAREQQYLGVINLVCDKDFVIPNGDMELLSSIGSQVSEIVANAWLHLKLVEKEAARQILLRSLVEAQEDERKRLARELHDGAGQTLTGLLVRLKTLENKAAMPGQREDLRDMQTLVSDTIEQVRTLAHQLRPAALEEFGLPLALEALVKDISDQQGLEGICQCQLESHEIPDEIEVVLYRIAQEGVTNILRHASASHMRLMVGLVPHGVSMTIEDDGVGFDPAALGVGNEERHLGLISMKERAEILGGSLDIYTAPEEGTTIQVHVPIVHG
jgi:signal transduction histidine kinase